MVSISTTARGETLTSSRRVGAAKVTDAKARALIARMFLKNMLRVVNLKKCSEDFDWIR